MKQGLPKGSRLIFIPVALKFVLFLLLLCCPIVLYAQQTISGIVNDASSNEPLVGVNVIIKGSLTGTITDSEGHYTIDTQSETDVLIFSSVGYQKQEISVSGNTIIDVALSPSAELIDELVVVGYGTMKKSDLTGSVASVKGEDIRKMPVLNAAEAIQGKAAGAFISRTSGRPGAGSTIKIRGIGSINNTNPLWVVDGVKGAPIGNVEDIESVEILKDASAASIYGAQAAGGVILVTTKRGSAKKTQVSLHSYYSSNQTMNMPELLDANQYSKLLLSTLVNDGIDTTNYNQYWNREWENSTDWIDVMFQNGYVHNHTLSVSGGNENANYYLSGGYADQKGTYYQSAYETFNFKINSDIKVTKWLKIGESLTFSSSHSNPETVDGIYKAVIRATPTIPVYDSTNILGGGFGYIPDSIAMFAQWAGGNPFAHEELSDLYEDENKLFANFYAEVLPLKGLTWRTNIAGRFSTEERELFMYPYYHSTFTNRLFNTLDKRLETGTYYLINSFATYNGEIGNHSFTAMQGFEASKSTSLWIATSGRNIPNPEVRNTQMGDANFLQSTMSNGHGASYSYFGRVNYGYAGKYLLTGNYRIDASDKFGANYSTGFFPSFSAGWRLSEESFMSNLSFLNDLKIRVGWGILGIDNIPSYLFASRYSQRGYSGFGSANYTDLIPGRYISAFTNQDIRWEEIRQWNYGVDFAVFGNRLLGSVEYYDKVTSDMLVNINLPVSSGFSSTRLNNGEISNRGVDLSLTWQQSFNNAAFNVTGNASRNINEVLSLRDPTGTSFFIASDQSRTEEGHPLASFYGYVADGIIRSQDELDALNEGSPDGIYQKPGTSPGDIKYSDIASIDEDGKIVMVPDGKITAADQTFIGNPWPKWVFGVTVGADFKSFDFTMYWQGVAGLDIYNQNKTLTEALFSDYNTSTRILDAWSNENPGGNVPRVSYNDPNQNFQNVSSYFLEDGSYLRLKNVQLGYTLPEKLSRAALLSSARVYVSGINLITLTKYTGVDPEFVSNTGSNTSQMVDGIKNYPQYKSWVFGLQIDF